MSRSVPALSTEMEHLCLTQDYTCPLQRAKGIRAKGSGSWVWVWVWVLFKNLVKNLATRNAVAL